MTPVYVAAGSNVDARRNIGRALRELRGAFADLSISPAYQNAAVGFEGEDFINLVVGFRTDDPLGAVLAELRRIEALCGRPPGAPKWAPRCMDLDMLLFGDLVGSFPGAILPRPDLIRRPYMLGPLADIAADVMHPTLNRSIGSLWTEFDRNLHPMRAVDLE